MRVNVIGGGVVGLLTALELQRQGVSVVVLDRQASGREASWAGGGIVSPLYPWRYPPAVSALAVWAQALYPELVQELREASGIDPELNPCGMLMLSADDHRDAMVWGRKYGRSTRTMQASELAAMGEGLERFGSGIWLPEVANVRNPRLLAALRATLLVRGGEIREGVEVTGWQRQGARITGVACGSGQCLEADAHIVAAGAWTGGLTGQTGLNLPIRPVRGQMMLFQAPDAGLRHILLYQGHYVIPRLDGHILCGSTLEEVGFDKGTTEEAARTLQAVAGQLVPALGSAFPVRQWSGLRPGSPDGIPFIGRHPEFDNLWVNAGHFRNGLVLAPASARLLRDLLLGLAPEVDPAPYELVG